MTSRFHPALACAVILILFAPAFASEEKAPSAPGVEPEAGDSVTAPEKDSEKEKPRDGEDKSKINISGYVQLWWHIATESENGQYQSVTFDKADEETLLSLKPEIASLLGLAADPGAITSVEEALAGEETIVVPAGPPDPDPLPHSYAIHVDPEDPVVQRFVELY